jgi:hypothetical protein
MDPSDFKIKIQGNDEVLGDKLAPLTHCLPQIPLDLAWGRRLDRLGERSAPDHLRRSVHQLSQNYIRAIGHVTMRQIGSEHANFFVFEQYSNVRILTNCSCEKHFDIV